MRIFLTKVTEKPDGWAIEFRAQNADPFVCTLFTTVLISTSRGYPVNQMSLAGAINDAAMLARGILSHMTDFNLAAGKHQE